MTAVGYLIPLPILAPVRFPDIQDRKQGASGRMDLALPPRPRIYRVPSAEHEYLAPTGYYDAEGRISYDGRLGQRIDVMA